MKRTAVLIYPKFCCFEISVALEMLAMAQKPITVFAKDEGYVRSEEGLSMICDKTISNIKLEEYDSLLLPGCMDLEPVITDDETMSFIKAFGRKDNIIAAISSAPLLLLKNGMLEGRKYMAGVEKEWLLEEGFSMEDMKGMIDIPQLKKQPVPEGCIRDGNVVTSVAWYFREWAVEFGRMLGIEVYPKSFGL